MLKNLTIVLGFALSLMVLTGCATSSGADENEETSTEDGENENGADEMAVGEGNNDLEQVEQIDLAAFESEDLLAQGWDAYEDVAAGSVSIYSGTTVDGAIVFHDNRGFTVTEWQGGDDYYYASAAINPLNFAFGAVVDEYVYYFNYDTTDLLRMNIHSGEEEKLAEFEALSYITGGDGTLFFLTGEQLFMTDFDAEEEHWRIDLVEDTGSVYDFVVDEDENAIYILGSNGLHAYEAETGDQKWFMEDDFLTDSMVIEDDVIYTVRSWYDEETTDPLYEIYEVSVESGEQSLITIIPDEERNLSAPALDRYENILFVDFSEITFAVDLENGEFVYTIVEGENREQGWLQSSKMIDNHLYHISYGSLEDGTDKTFVTVTDPNSGEVVERYHFETKYAYGPFEDNGQIFVWTEEEFEDNNAYLLHD